MGDVSGSSRLASSLLSPDFSLFANPQILQIAQGQTQRTILTVTSINGFNGNVSLTENTVPQITTAVSSSIVPVTPNMPGDSTMFVIVPPSLPPGGYNIAVIGTSGSISENTTVHVTVTQSTGQPDFYLSVNTTALSIPQGQSGTATITAYSVNGFSGTIKLGAQTGLPTPSFNPENLTLLVNGSANSTMTVTLLAGTMTGVYSILVSGRIGALSHFTSVTVTVTPPPNQPPVPRFTFTPTNPVSGDLVLFNASASYDPDGTVTGYLWTWGDGQSGSGVHASHVYNSPGSYSTTLAITDNGGAMSRLSRYVAIAPGPLSVNIATEPSPPTGIAPLTVGFNATARGGLGPYMYSWDFGDGRQGSGQQTSHTYTAQGNYNVSITVTDSQAPRATSTVNIPVSVHPATGSLTVTVKDSGGKLIAGAAVKITSGPTGQSLPPAQTTSGDGTVTFSGLLPGTYTYQLSASGYSGTVTTSTTVTAGQTQTSSATLSKAQPAVTAPADYTIVYVAAGVGVLVAILGFFLALRWRRGSKPVTA